MKAKYLNDNNCILDLVAWQHFPLHLLWHHKGNNWKP